MWPKDLPRPVYQTLTVRVHIRLAGTGGTRNNKRELNKRRQSIRKLENTIHRIIIDGEALTGFPVWWSPSTPLDTLKTFSLPTFSKTDPAANPQRFFTMRMNALEVQRIEVLEQQIRHHFRELRGLFRLVAYERGAFSNVD